MARNYPAYLSVVALCIGVVAPIAVSLAFPDQFNAFARRQGPGMLWLVVFWVGGWSVVGLVTGVAGLIMSFHGYSGRVPAIIGLVGSVFFFLAQLANTGLLGTF